MQYQSTRDSRHTASAAQAILQGIAPDGGLYMLSDPGALSFPMAELVHMSAMEISERVLGLLLPGFTREELHAIVTAAYTHKFETEDLVPLVPVGIAISWNCSGGLPAPLRMWPSPCSPT